MVRSKMHFLGNSLQRWLVVTALLSAAAGAAVGIVLSGQVAGTVSTAVSQSLLVDSTNVTGLNDVYAGSTLTFELDPIEEDAVAIGDDTYTFFDSINNANAREVLVGATTADSRDNLVAAINRAAGAGTKYSTATAINPAVSAAAGTGSPVTLIVAHKAVGSGANSIPVDPYLDGQWDADTLTGGTGALKTAQFNAVSDDGTKFTAATEIMTGDGARINVVAVNRSTDTMAVSIKLDLRPGITADVDGAEDAGSTPSLLGGTGVYLGGATGDSCVRVSLSEWKCKLASNVPSGEGPGDGASDFRIKLALNDEVPPGFYSTGVAMTQVENKQ
jgi:hypothetical protein